MEHIISKNYRPNNGEEIILYILHTVEKKLREHPRLGSHLAIHNFEFVGGLKITGFTTPPFSIPISGGAEASDIPPDAIPLLESIELIHSPIPPDMVREHLAEAPVVKKSHHKKKVA